MLRAMLAPTPRTVTNALRVRCWVAEGYFPNPYRLPNRAVWLARIGGRMWLDLLPAPLVQPGIVGAASDPRGGRISSPNGMR
jgi:hypothetical protein